MKVRLAIAALLLSTSGLSTSGALALECGGFEFPQCDGPDQQFAGGFKPDLPLGGFGGGECQATRTPVVFVHGNADRAISWDSPASDGGPSVYATLRAGGYNDCELFGVTYLSPEERDHPARNDHNPEKYQVLTSFLEAVTSHAGQPQVDVVAHSLGSSLAIAALDRSDSWGRVRRFINIAGGLRGLGSCLSAGPANPLSPTCAAGQPARGTCFVLHPHGRGAGSGPLWLHAGLRCLRQGSFVFSSPQRQGSAQRRGWDQGLCQGL
jgi:pimeloyl-ACP methyl ester carboxylesterase